MLTLHQINNIIDSEISLDISTKFVSKITNKCFIYSFIENFYKSNKIFDKETFVIALIYMNRYNTFLKLNNKNIKKILETCIILANKYSSEYEIIESGPLELHFLNCINWNLYVSENEYNIYKSNIEKFIKL